MPSKKMYEKCIADIEKVSKEDLKKTMEDLCRERDYLRFLLSCVEEAIFVVSSDGVVPYFNEGVRQVFSKSLSEKTRISIDELIDDVQVRACIKSLVSAGYRKVNVEQGMLVPQEKYLNISVLPLPQSKNHPEMLVLVTDISDKKRLYDEKDRNDKIQSLINLSAGIAHEIGNPLNSIAIHLKLLEDKLKNVAIEQTARQSFSIIREETTRLDKIIRNFLEATRSGRLHFKMVNFNKTVGEVCTLMQPEFEARQAQLILNLDERLPEALFDEDKIRRMLINVVKNASESLGQDGIVEVSTMHKEKLVCVSVKDNGCGIPEKDVGRIFDAYFTTKKNGAGLGLMMVYNIVRDHGGRIEVRSREGEGTEFNFLFPLRREKLKLPKGVSRRS